MENMTNKESYRTTISSTLDAVDDVSAEIYSFIAKRSGNELAFRAGLLVIEICTNIVKYGYEKSPDEKIWVSIDKNNSSYTILIEDESKPFNLLEEYHNIDLDKIDKLERGGMGIFLIKSLSKDINYSYSEGKNKLTIIV
ncbi:MAG: ATP-binding protein [Thermotogota bacterium]|nr:ATP-binding protein [Thermotogota bacterium]